MDPLQRMTGRQRVQIRPDGDLGDVELFRQAAHPDEPVPFDQGQDLLAPDRGGGVAGLVGHGPIMARMPNRLSRASAARRLSPDSPQEVV